MGDTANDVWPSHDYVPTGGIVTTISITGVDVGGVGALGRATLRAAAGGSDGAVRAALVSVLGDASGREWDNGPHQDGLHGPFVAGYVPIRVRVRAMMGDLP